MSAKPHLAHVQAPSSSSETGARSSRAPGRRTRLFLLGAGFVAFT